MAAASVPGQLAVTTSATVAEFNVVKYGAVGDGKTSNTGAFRASIEACAAAGGGRVVVPKGTFVTGPIQLMSRVELHVDAGALVLFSSKFDDYPLELVNYEGRDTVSCRSPISGDHLDHVSITGAGTFDAQGDFWRPVKKNKVTPERWNEVTSSGGSLNAGQNIWFPSTTASGGDTALKALRASKDTTRIADYTHYRDLLRPCLLLFSNCTNVLLDGPTFQNSPNWNLHLLLSDHIGVRNVTIFNPEYAQNGDGIDFDACRDVLMENCDVNAGDDGICLKSGKDEEGRLRGRPTENVTIRNCSVGRAHGGFVIGSEMSGGVRNVTVTNCTFNGTQTGLRFKTARGRGNVVENIRINEIKMVDIQEAAITFDMYYFSQGKFGTTEPVTQGTPIFRQFQISNVTCHGAKQAIFIRGLPEMPISDITLKNVHINADQGVKLINANNIVLSDVHVECKEGPPIDIRNVTHLMQQDFTANVLPN